MELLDSAATGAPTHVARMLPHWTGLETEADPAPCDPAELHPVILASMPELGSAEPHGDHLRVRKESLLSRAGGHLWKGGLGHMSGTSRKEPYGHPSGD